MIMDAFNQFDPLGTTVTVSAVSTNTSDRGVNRDIGIGDDPALKLVIGISASFAAAGAATVQAAWQTCADNASWATLTQSPAYALSQLAAGQEIFRIDAPIGTQRYNRLYYTVANGPFTAGALSAQLVLDRQANPAYPKNFDTSYI